MKKAIVITEPFGYNINKLQKELRKSLNIPIIKSEEVITCGQNNQGCIILNNDGNWLNRLNNIDTDILIFYIDIDKLFIQQQKMYSENRLNYIINKKSIIENKLREYSFRFNILSTCISSLEDFEKTRKTIIDISEKFLL